MSYKHVSWNPYGNASGGTIVDITIKDSSRMKLGHFVSYSEKQYQEILRTIKKKFGLSYPVEYKNVLPENKVRFIAAEITTTPLNSTNQATNT